MSADVYSRYLQSLGEKNIIKKTEVPAVNQRKDSLSVLTSDRETIMLLKEISSKLDNIGQRDDKKDFPEIRESTNLEIDLAIINGSVVLPDSGVLKADLYVKNGKIYSLGYNDNIKAKRVIDAKGQYVIPGVIDPHVHLGLFAATEKELETETKSALFGGVTTLGCYFNVKDSYFNSFPETMESINKYSYTDIIPHFVISSSEQCREVLDYINHLGVTSFKVYMNGIPGLITDVDDAFLLDLFEQIKKSNKKCMVCSHTENRDIVRRAYKNVKDEKGDSADVTDWTQTHPDIAEEEAVVRISYLAQKTGVPVYLVHISSALSANSLRKIKPFNKYVNIETTSPYLSLTRFSNKDDSLKMEPPFRDAEDVEELWRAVDDDIVDTIGTDNVTMTKEEKRMGSSIWEVIPGYPALETHLPVLINEGVIKRGIAIEKVISKITKKPAEIFNVYPRKGTLLPGSDADIVILDLDAVKEVSASNLHSRSDFSIYEGRRIQGWPLTTIKAGEVLIENGKYVGQKAKGECITR